MTAGSHAQTKFTVQVKDKDAQHVYLGGLFNYIACIVKPPTVIFCET